MTAKSPYDVIRSAFETERVGAKYREALDEVDASTIRELAGNIESIADAIDTATEAFDAIEDAEGRDDRADAREAALEALDELVSALNQIIDIDPDFRAEILGDGEIE